MGAGIERISENIWVLKDRGHVVTFQSSASPKVNADTGKVQTITYGKDKSKSGKIMYWGSRNCLPQEREALIANNNIIPELLGTKRDITLGGGLFCYRERIVEQNGKSVILPDPVEMPPEIAAFFEANDIESYLQTACKNLMMHANTFTEMTCLAGGAVERIKVHEWPSGK